MQEITRRVADRYAAIIEPPPKMVAAVEALLTKYWAAEKYAETGDLLYKRLAGRTKPLAKGQAVVKKLKINLAGWKYGGREIHRRIREHVKRNMAQLYEIASKSSNPDIFTHLYGTLEEGVKKTLDAAKDVSVEIRAGKGTAGWTPAIDTLAFPAGQPSDQKDLHRTVVHELRHFAQSLISQAVTGIPESHVGLPSRKIQTPEWSDLGLGFDAQAVLEKYRAGEIPRAEASRLLGQNLKEHHLKDVEFDTDLGDSIADFKDALAVAMITIPGGKKIAFQLYTGQQATYPSGWDTRKKFAYMILLKKRGFETDSFFAALKEHAPGKYRAALKKMYQEIGHLLKDEPDLIQYKTAKRPVPLNWRIIDDLATRIIAGLKPQITKMIRKSGEKALLGHNNKLLAVEFNVTDMNREPVDKGYVLVRSREKQPSRWNMSGAAGKIGPYPGIVIELDGKQTLSAWDFYLSYAQFWTELKKLLAHEMTHLVEDRVKTVNRPTTKEIPAPLKPADYREYVNQPHEVRAHMQEVVLEAIPVAKKLAKHFQGQELVQYLLFKPVTMLYTWKEIRDDLTPANRKKIVKAVYHALQKEGLV